MTLDFNRRQFLTLSGAGVLSAACPVISLAEESVAGTDYTLLMKANAVSVLPNTLTPVFTFNGSVPAPTLRLKQGVPIRIAVINKLQQPTTIHWHGIRLDNAMDGVPWLTQKPIMAGETFVYEFTCPDAGSFWYHPHVNSLEQLSKGLVGPIIVEETDKPDFDEDIVLGLKDWLLNDDGSFKPFTSPRNAARMGTLGNIAGINGIVSNVTSAEGKPVISYDIPAGGAVRLRFFNMDNTRVFTVSLRDQIDALVLAADGMPMVQPIPLDAYPIGAGMRVDLGFIAPSKVGQELVVYDRKGRFHFEMCRLRVVESKAKARTALPKLPLNPIPEPDLKQAKELKFIFEWEGALSPTDINGKTKSVIWTINRRNWEGASKDSIPDPLAILKVGDSYKIHLRNNTSHIHPIHMHGEIFKVLASNKREVHQHYADTVLVGKDEMITIALKATNPGKWMFHCHVIEHMKTGLMGY